MLKNISQLEFKINERLYVFQCPSDSPISDVKESLNKFIQFACQVEDEAKAAIERSKNEQEQKDDEEQEAI